MALCVCSHHVNGEKIKICKTFYLHTLGIRDNAVRKALETVTDGDVVKKDQRGKHERTKISQDIREAIKEHINRFPQVESHYLRKQTKREYFRDQLSLAKMYRNQYQESKGKPLTKMWLYEHIFNTDFNIVLRLVTW